MSKIILTCGHEVDDFDHVHNVMTKGYARDGMGAISYQVVCGPCEDSYRQDGYLFDTEEEAFEWLGRNRND